MAIDQEMLNEIEAEKTRIAEEKAAAKAKAAGGAGFFSIKNGEQVKIRPLMNKFIPLFHHSIWNNGTGKWDVNAICAQSRGVGKEFCAHCQKSAETNNKKLAAVKQFAVAVWLYGVKVVATGEARTYKKEGQDEPQLVRGLRYAQFKPGDPIFENLLTMYKMAGDITLRDILIKQTGEKLEKEFTIDPLDPTPFTVEGVPTLTVDGIIEWFAEKNPPALIDQPGVDPFADARPATTVVKSTPNLDF